jgi:hypothetical protein
LELLSHSEPSFWQQSRNLVNFITALDLNRLTKQMDRRIALVIQEFFIRLLKRLRYDVLDVWLHESLKLMKRVTECSDHNKDCSRGIAAAGNERLCAGSPYATLPRLRQKPTGTYEAGISFSKGLTTEGATSRLHLPYRQPISIPLSIIDLSDLWACTPVPENGSHHLHETWKGSIS